MTLWRSIVSVALVTGGMWLTGVIGLASPWAYLVGAVVGWALAMVLAFVLVER